MKPLGLNLLLLKLLGVSVLERDACLNIICTLLLVNIVDVAYGDLPFNNTECLIVYTAALPVTLTYFYSLELNCGSPRQTGYSDTVT